MEQGKLYYGIQNFQIVTYTYLCVHPRGLGEYHILIDNLTQEPIRIYIDRLNLLFTDKESAVDELKKKLSDRLQTIDERYE